MPLFGSSVEEKLKQVPLNEKICMRKFFDFAIKNDQAAHVIFFDNKPVCFTGVVVRDKHKTFKDILYLKGWHAFKKNEQLFPHSNFIFNEKIFADENLKIINIYIINKRAIVTCLQEHANLFKKTFGPDFNPKKFISQLEGGYLMTSLINDDEMLLGILLGFGEESSKAFQEEQKNYTGDFAPNWSDTYCGIEGKRPKGCKIYSVGFMGNPNSPEVKALIATYDKELEAIWEIYQQSKDPLNIILERLCAD